MHKKCLVSGTGWLCAGACVCVWVCVLLLFEEQVRTKLLGSLISKLLATGSVCVCVCGERAKFAPRKTVGLMGLCNAYMHNTVNLCNS